MIDINKPDVIIYIKDLHRPIDISRIVAALGNIGYSYSFRYIPTNKIIKYGMSDNYSSTPGERVYRQIANLPGWDRIPASGCGKDILTAVALFEKEQGIKLHKDDCILEIWCSSTPSDDEDELLCQHRDNNQGRLPAGNIKGTRLKGMVSKSVFNKFFVEEE